MYRSILVNHINICSVHRVLQPHRLAQQLDGLPEPGDNNNTNDNNNNNNNNGNNNNNNVPLILIMNMISILICIIIVIMPAPGDAVHPGAVGLQQKKNIAFVSASISQSIVCNTIVVYYDCIRHHCTVWYTTSL